jgi:RecA/RadA recombinase
MRDFTDLPFVSFAIASLTGLSLPERQMILEIASEKERLESLDIFLTDSVTKLAAKEAIEERVKTNGHFKH